MGNRSIGIDLGTTNSCVACVEQGDPLVIPNALGSRTTPSMVGFLGDGETVVGEIARRQAATFPEQTFYAVKRLMGRKADSEEAKALQSRIPFKIVAADNGDAAVQVEDKVMAPPQIAALILGELKATAESFFGEPVEKAVITVPAYFDDSQRKATEAAGKIAGLEVERIINEPTAAALAYGLDSKDDQVVAVYDLGGGTFDISILEIAGDVFHVHSTSGDTFLGGEDLDAALMDYLLAQFEEETGIDTRGDAKALHRLREQVARTKHELSGTLETEIHLPFFAAGKDGPKHLIAQLSRAKLESIVLPIIERTLEPCARALADAKMSTSKIDTVLLVGGQTRMPLVQRKVEEFFGKPPSRGINPDEVVAMGAALQSAALSGAVDSILLLDVTPLSLGVETAGGVFCPMIPRNTTVPAEHTEVFTTTVDNQDAVPIHVLQGEREMAEDNHSLSRFELGPLAPAPRGEPQIAVRFEIDVNGVFRVSAKDMIAGTNQEIEVVASSGLTNEEVDALVEEAARAKDSDADRKALAELRTRAEGLVYTSEATVEDAKGSVPEDLLDALQDATSSLRQSLEGTCKQAELLQHVEHLEALALRVADALFGE